jgi:NADH:ubiquinone oxidoreductase subunit 6 (subunit J)
LLAALLAQVDLPGLGREGPDDLRSLLFTSFALLAIGFVIGIIGHMTQIRSLVATGIVLIFVATAFFIIAVGQYG